MTHDSDSTADISRRGFLRNSGLAAGAAAGALAFGPAQAKTGDDLPAKWDETVDVLVVGSGFAGLAAALEARSAKADVMVIDKMAVFGGNSIINGGDFSAPGTKMQKKEGIEDSPELMLKDMMKAGGYINHPPLAKTVAENAVDALEWCQTYVGAEFTRVNFHGGHSVKRAHQTSNQSGSGLITPMLAKCKETGVKLAGRTKLVRYLKDKNGRVVGAEVLKGYRFPDDKTGKPVGINEHIGRRPIAAFGNSDGDLQMLQWTTMSGSGVRFGLIVHHTDAEREYAYDRQSHFGKLDLALDAANLNKWTVVDMKKDWKRVFAFE